MANATISKVALVNTANGPRIALSLSNGDTQWYPLSYIEKLLTANFMTGARPTVLVGTEVSYDKHSYKAGDFSVDNVGKPTDVKHTKAGTKLINFTFGEIVGNVSEFDKAQMLANAVAAASVKVAGLFARKTQPVQAPVQAPIAETVAETVAEEEQTS